MNTLYDSLYEACVHTGFKVGYSRDYHSVAVDFFRENNKTTMVRYDSYFGWTIYSYNQEELVSRKVTEPEAVAFLKDSFAEFGTDWVGGVVA